MSITTILTVYRRPQNLLYQLQAIANQTVKSDEIWIWHNYNEEVDTNDLHDIFVEAEIKYHCRIFSCNFNWKYCGRFSAACLVNSDFTAILDDDTIPAPEWFSNCLETYQKTEGIIGGLGVRLHTNSSYMPMTRYGWTSANDETTEVDLVGHAWFFPARYISYMWREKPMWENGEDMHFSAMCQIHGGIKTYVAPHPRSRPQLWSSMYGYQLGTDNVASSTVRNHTVFYQQRDECVRRLVKLGWKTVC